ncbi:hypothetical protein [Nostoc sp. 'Peltigera membranacea cyanobiont' N6]|uniref:hypothetical protein n=1 Tax=Nostoc sp. 'Peltigera membranacea cyanobiont' N6 TaxID=1261031 RepID=UPI000CF333E9|nr:hypothetical protein [Nostoc sp. 'Peltigera membranacea cyanobiont' N6]AVH67047.1 hypothetical protein NPM_5616 [Nostoc sp. 'Peltigera membranacea cyanobiont' N6]
MSNLSDRLLTKDFKGEEIAAYWFTTSSKSRVVAYNRDGLVYTLKCLLFNKPYIAGLKTSENSRYPGNFEFYQLRLIVEVIRMLILETVNPLK